MAFVSVTRLRIRAVWFMPRFALHAVRSLNQCKRANGFLDGSLLRGRTSTFWALTLWRDEAACAATWLVART
jgi:heme-degrading monooxygenase HmoA